MARHGVQVVLLDVVDDGVLEKILHRLATTQRSPTGCNDIHLYRASEQRNKRIKEASYLCCFPYSGQFLVYGCCFWQYEKQEEEPQ